MRNCKFIMPCPGMNFCRHLEERMESDAAHELIFGCDQYDLKPVVQKEIVNAIVNTGNDSDVYIVDFTGEYHILSHIIQCSVINAGHSYGTCLNPFDFVFYDFSVSVAQKAEFVISLLESLNEDGFHYSIFERMIISHCVFDIYQAASWDRCSYMNFLHSNQAPTIQDFCKSLEKMDVPKAHKINSVIKNHMNGILCKFSHFTNAIVSERFTVYDMVRHLCAFMVVLDHIQNRMIQNSCNGRKTFVYINPVNCILQSQPAVNLLSAFWKNAAQYHGICTGILYNTDVLDSYKYLKPVFENSGFVLTDRQTPQGFLCEVFNEKE